MDTKNKIFAVVFSTLLLFLGCASPQAQAPVISALVPFEYDLSSPTKAYKLPESLSEISGMTYLSNNELLAVEDEDGFLFQLHLGDTLSFKAIPFGPKGDYEGIALVGPHVLILRSDGLILRIKNWATQPQLEEMQMPLGVINNTEGLAYDAKSNSLLIACKEWAQIGQGSDLSDLSRAVYRFDLKNNRFMEQPAFVLNDALLIGLAELNGPDNPLLEDILSQASESFPIYPSEVARHPITGDIYISSARTNNCLLVLTPEGALKNCVALPESVFEQPEGICFAPNGDMYISSEGEANTERLFVFAWQGKK